MKIKKIFYKDQDGNYTLEYDSITSVLIKKTKYSSINNDIDEINEYDINTKNLIKKTKMYDNHIDYIKEYNPITGKIRKEIRYEFDREIVRCVINHDKDGKLIQRIYYGRGKIDYVEIHTKYGETEIIKHTHYNPDGTIDRQYAELVNEDDDDDDE